MPTTHTIQIKKMPDPSTGDIQWKVVPGRIAANAGDKIMFQVPGNKPNPPAPLKPSAITIVISKTTVDGTGKVRSFSIKENQTERQFKIHANAHHHNRDKTYCYAVFCHADDEVATGNSYPRIIIKR